MQRFIFPQSGYKVSCHGLLIIPLYFQTFYDEIATGESQHQGTIIDAFRTKILLF